MIVVIVTIEFVKTIATELLGVKNPKCSPNESKRKLWNKDLAAVLNFCKILISLRETSIRPTIFTRKQVPKPVSKKKTRNPSAEIIALVL